MRKLLAALAAAATALALLIAGTLPAQAAAPSYHIMNSGSSNYSLYIFSGPNCDGSMHVLSNGDKAVSLGWDSMRASHRYSTLILDDKTGRTLDSRDYLAYECNDHLSDNSHYAYVP